jgi:hypothetical protein
MNGKHISVTKNKHITIVELLEAVFSIWPKPRLYNEEQQQPFESSPVEGE